MQGNADGNGNNHTDTHFRGLLQKAGNTEVLPPVPLCELAAEAAPNAPAHGSEEIGVLGDVVHSTLLKRWQVSIGPGSDLLNVYFDGASKDGG